MSSKLCTVCSLNINTKQLFLWSFCHHLYCISCAISIINKSLSSLNKIPACIHSKCNQLLSIEHGHQLQSHLLVKYRISDNFVSYNRECHLMYGYTRKSFLSLSNRIISLIFDFYNIRYSSTIDCVNCKGSGYDYIDCKYCDEYGNSINCPDIKTVTIDCDECDESGYDLLWKKCNKCIYQNIDRHSERERICGYVPECNQCKGLGRFRIFKPCKKCNGNGALFKYKNCIKCSNSTTFKHECRRCDGSGIIKTGICIQCNGYKQIVTLDYNKLINKQSLCYKCNQYFPNDMILNWSVCHHSYCIQCVLWYIPAEINNNRIPMCYVIDCKQELTLNNVISMGMKQKRLLCKLQKLIYKKHPFLCIKCKSLTSFEQLFLWNNCNHSYCKNCASNMIIISLSLLNKIPKCEYIECNQLLNVKQGDTVKSLLLKRYQISSNKQQINSYHNKIYLICGYIRRIPKIKYIPHEIISSIFDYYYLIISSLINCYICKSSGYQLIHCEKCEGVGYIEQSSYIEWITSKNGTYPILQCGRYKKQKCLICNGTGHIPLHCSKCYGISKIIVLDFNKLCNKQSLCDKCNYYFPNNIILFWTKCYHKYCYQCIAKYIRKQIDDKKIPICCILNCDKEIDKEFVMEHMQLIFNKTYWSHPFLLLNKLENLYFRKDRFLCCYCFEWHLMEELFLWSDCTHCYAKKCAKMYIENNYLIKDKSVFNIFKNQSIPQCQKIDCHKLLDITDAIMLGITKYQYQTLNYLQRVSNVDATSCTDIQLHDEDKIYLQNMTQSLFVDTVSVSSSPNCPL